MIFVDFCRFTSYFLYYTKHLAPSLSLHLVGFSRLLLNETVTKPAHMQSDCCDFLTHSPAEWVLQGQLLHAISTQSALHTSMLCLRRFPSACLSPLCLANSQSSLNSFSNSSSRIPLVDTGRVNPLSISLPFPPCPILVFLW